MKDYEMGIKNGLKMALPCELSLPKLPNCVGEHNVTSWSNCYGERASANGGAYRGTYLEGKANGKGEFINSDGTRYLGDYLKGQRNGTGKEYSSSGVLLKQGQWNKGNFEDVSSQKSNSQSSSSQSASSTYAGKDDEMAQRMGSCTAYYSYIGIAMAKSGSEETKSKFYFDYALKMKRIGEKLSKSEFNKAMAKQMEWLKSNRPESFVNTDSFKTVVAACAVMADRAD